jgi:hypothetical protein
MPVFRALGAIKEMLGVWGVAGYTGLIEFKRRTR